MVLVAGGFVPRPDRRTCSGKSAGSFFGYRTSQRACVFQGKKEFASLCGARARKAVGTRTFLKSRRPALLELLVGFEPSGRPTGGHGVHSDDLGGMGMDGFAKTLSKDVVPQIQSGQAKRLLGFNEPDKKEQANMPYTEALKYWPLLEKLGIPLCSPACANPLSDVDDSTQGVRGTWMRDFMREADKRKYRMDYIGVHWYGGTSPVFQARRSRFTRPRSPALLISVCCGGLGSQGRFGELHSEKPCSLL